MTIKHAKAPLALCLSILAAAGAVTGHARAESCGMGDIDWYATERARVSRAEELLRQGEPREAARVLQRMWPKLRDAVPVLGSVPEIADGVRLMALAAVRAHGDVPSENGWSSWTPRERADNVSWGIRRLRMLAAAAPGSSVIKTDLGEALAGSVETEEEATDVLEALDDTDEMATPEGYAALAGLRSRKGDGLGAMAAAAHCRLNASNEEIQCSSANSRDVARATASR
jgi:hypothetical protein